MARRAGLLCALVVLAVTPGVARGANDTTPRTYAEWRQYALDQIGPAGASYFTRITRIAQIYRQLAQADPEAHIWAGTASYVAGDVAQKLLFAKLVGTGLPPLPGATWQPWGTPTDVVYEALARGNLAIYSDIAPVLFAYQHGSRGGADPDAGLEAVRAMGPELRPDLVRAIEQIAQGVKQVRAGLASGDRAAVDAGRATILAGSQLIALVEQRDVAQGAVFGRDPLLWKLATGLIRAMGSPIPGDVRTKFPEPGNLAHWEDRAPYANDLLAVFQDLFVVRREQQPEPTDRYVPDVKADDRGEPFVLPPGGGGGAAGALVPQSDPGGIDFSSLDLRYLAEPRKGGKSVAYAFRVPHANGARSRGNEHDAAVASSDAFFTWLALPRDKLWVNLNPSEPDRIIDPQLGRVDAGRVLLEADLRMKKTVAALVHPDSRIGAEFWRQIDAHRGSAGALCFSFRQWIVPAAATVRETGDWVYIVDAPLDVKLESEYLRAKGLRGAAAARCPPAERGLERQAEAAFRRLILPKVVARVHHGPEYAALRRVYLSRVAAEWYRERHRHGSAYASLIDRGDATPWRSRQPWSPRAIFDRYVASLRRGEFRVTRSERRGATILTHIYAYGGVDFSSLRMNEISDRRLVEIDHGAPAQVFQGVAAPAGFDDGEAVWLGGLYLPHPRAGASNHAPLLVAGAAVAGLALLAAGSWAALRSRRRRRLQAYVRAAARKYISDSD